MNNPKDMLVSDERLDAFIRNHVPLSYKPDHGAYGYRETLRAALIIQRDLYEAKLTKLRSERDELVGALDEIVYQADEGMPIIDVSPCIMKASKLLAKHKPE